MYKYDKENNWLEDGDGNIVCQFWNKFEDDYLNSVENGKKVEAALNCIESAPKAPNSDYAKCADDILKLDLADKVINKHGCLVAILKRHFA